MIEADRRIRVMLADASRLVLIGMREVLEKEADVVIVATATDGEEAVARALELEPDVLVADVDLPVVRGDQVAQRVRRDLPSVAVILVTDRDDEQRLFDAIRGGAAAYLAKDCEPEELVATIRRVRGGEFVINEQVFTRPAVASRVLEEFRGLNVYGPASAKVFAPLSRREMQVLESIAQGRSNKEVAGVLAISEQTVKNHMSSILRKLSVNDRTQAVVYALRQGWIKLGEMEKTR